MRHFKSDAIDFIDVTQTVGRDASADANAHTDPNSDANAHTDPNSDANTHTHTHTDANTHSHADAHTERVADGPEPGRTSRPGADDL